MSGLKLGPTPETNAAAKATAKAAATAGSAASGKWVGMD